MEKDIQNADAITHKLGPASIRATNHRLEIAREEQWKREEIVERRKTETMATRHQRARRGIILSSKEEENYESDTGDEIDLDQANDDKNLLQL